MNITAVSDLHGNLPTLPPCDLLVIAGDLCPDNPHTLRNRVACATLQADWLDEHFVPWLKVQKFDACVFVWGNHDFVGEHPLLVPDFTKETGKEVFWLQDSGTVVKVKGEFVRVWGAPWVGNIPQWAFNLPQAELTRKWEYIPGGLDILVTHAPPFKIGDFCARGNVGDPGLRAQLDSMDLLHLRPALHFFGHIHEGKGGYVKGMHNVSYVDGRYKPYPMPVLNLEYECGVYNQV